MASSLMERMLKAGTVKTATVLSASKFFKQKDPIVTKLPILNVAFSGRLDGGLTSGLTILAGASKSFKTLLGLYAMKAYLDKYPDGIAILYDSEFGITPEYLATNGIDTDRVLHIPIEDIEQLKFDVVKRLNEVSKDDHVFIMVDSVGNLASKKEVEDAEKESSAADMTRAKQLKSLFRIITPKLTLKDIPCICVNHIYMTQEMFSKPIVSGGCVLAGTEIQTPAGLKRVEDFQIGDLVNTLSGPMPVTHTWNPETLEEGTPECYEITFEDGYTVTVSDKHRFLIDGKWVEAKDLIEGLVCTTVNP